MATGETIQASGERRFGATQLLQGITSVVAPAALLTGIAYYFGWTRTEAYARYFGIDTSQLGLSTNEYVLRSLDPLFVPVGTALVVLAAAALAHALVERGFEQELKRPQLEVLGRAAAVAGAALFLFGALTVGGVFSVHYLLETLSPGAGLLLLACAVHVRRRLHGYGPLPTGAVAATGLLVLLSLFWATSRYAEARGQSSAAEVAANLAVQPGVILYSTRPLGIAGLHESHSSEPRAVYPVRYDGLRLLTRSDGKYFLLPAGWKHSGTSPAVVLPDTDSILVELTPGETLRAKSFALSAAAHAVLGAAAEPVPKLDIGLLLASFSRVPALKTPPTYGLSFWNKGRSPLAGGRLDVSLQPAREVYVSPEDARCRIVSRGFSCSLDTLRRGDSATIHFVLPEQKVARAFVRVRVDGKTRRDVLPLEP
jgi:hypothetical protein